MTVSLVTGAAGFIGSHLAARLLELGHAVVGVDSLAPTYPRARKLLNLSALQRDPRFRFVEGDLSHLDLWGIVPDAGFLFHLAARPGVRQSWGHFFPAYVKANIVATWRLLETARVRRPRTFVYASSSSVYAPDASPPWEESSPTRPLSPYGLTKLAGENLCLAYAAKYGLPVVCLRYFTVYGPRQRPDMAIQRFIEAILAGRKITVHGDGEQRRDFTFVGDVVAATILASTNQAAHGQVINVGAGRPASLNEVIRQLAILTGRTPEVRHVPLPPGEPRETWADTRKASALLGFAPRHDLHTGLAEQVAWTQALLLDSRSANSQAQ